MKFKDMSLKKLRKRYINPEYGFCIRIRENSNDIVYYNGIKAFEIQHNDGENYKIEMPKNIYNFNRTNIKNVNNILQSIIDLRQNMSKYFAHNISSITISISYAQYKNINNKLEEILNKIKKEMGGKYDKNIQLNYKDIKENFDNQYRKYEKDKTLLQEQFRADTEKLKKSINELKNKEIKYKIKVKDLLNQTDITNIEYIFIKNFIFDEDMKYTGLFKIPKFSYSRFKH